MNDIDPPVQLSGIRAIIDLYDVFFIDIWGVLHDGITKYPGAEEALRFLKEREKTVILLSNAPRRAFLVQEKMRDIGYADNLYTRIVSSGEAVRHYITTGYYGEKVKGRYYMLGGSRDGDLLEDTDGFIRTYDIDTADFVLLTGYDDSMLRHEDVLPELARIRARDLFIVNANPDKRIERMNGDSVPCAGAIVDTYRSTGGNAVETGKPYKEMYAFAKKDASVTAHQARCVCIGDNMDTDIKGAADNGMDGYLVASGMHTQAIEAQGSAAFLKQYTIPVKGILRRFAV